jgi:hypothetical protein
MATLDYLAPERRNGTGRGGPRCSEIERFTDSPYAQERSRSAWPAAPYNSQPAIAVRLTAGIIAQRGDGLRPGPSLKGEMLPVERDRNSPELVLTAQAPSRGAFLFGRFRRRTTGPFSSMNSMSRNPAHRAETINGSGRHHRLFSLPFAVWSRTPILRRSAAAALVNRTPG